jgi:hypothetical protein
MTCAILFGLGLLLIGCTETRMMVTTSFVYETKQGQRSPIPPNWMGDSDQQALLQLNDKKMKVESSQGELDFERRLKDFPKKQVCVVYVSAHAALAPYAVDPTVDQMEVKDADVVLFPTTGDFDAVSSRVPMNDLWNALRRLPNHKKLVLLDVSRLQNQWRLGVYDNFAVAGIQEAVAREKIPNLYVMTSCAAGETSWVCPDLGGAEGQSVFGYFVAQGLSGEADKQPDGKFRDHRVSVRELFEYVHRRVDDWVQRNRDAAGQHPQLFPSEGILKGTDSTFVVCAVSNRKPSTNSTGQNTFDGVAIEEFQETQEQLFKVWERRAKLEQDAMSPNSITHLEPIRCRALTHLLMRAEEFLIHHRATQAKQAIAEADSLCGELEQRFQRGRFTELALHSKFLGSLASRFGLGATEENNPVKAGESQPALPDDQLRNALQEAHQKHSIPQVLAPADIETCRNDLVNLRHLAERVAFGHHTVLPWLQADLVVADRARREAEDAYFVLGSAEILERSTRARDQFQALDQRARSLEETQFLLHRAMAILPDWLMFASERWIEDRRGRGEIMNRYHGPILKNHEPRADILETVWTTTKDARPSSVLDVLEVEILASCLLAIELRDLLPERFSNVSQERLRTLKERTKKLQDRMQSIEQKLQTEAERLRNTSQTQWSDWRLKRDLLRCPNLKPDTRRELLRKLIQESTDLAKDQEQAKPSLESPPVDADVALWQMLCTVHALSLGPIPPGLTNDTLWDRWHKARRGEERGSQTTFISLGRLIRSHWSRHLSEVTNECGESQSREAARDCRERKDQSARILHPSDAISLASNDQTPPIRFDEFLLAESLLNAAQRYTEDYWKGWYDSAADACLEKAKVLGGKPLAEDYQKTKLALKARGEAELVLDCAPIDFGTRPKVVGSLRIKREAHLPPGLATSWLGTPDDDRLSVKNLAQYCTPKSVGLSVGDAAAIASKQSLSVDRPSIAANCQSSLVAPKLYFRGHSFDDKQLPALFNPCKPNGVVWQFLPAPSTGAIQVDGSDRQSIVFVLDCSGSMLPFDQKVDNWTPAKEALLKVLGDLLKISQAQEIPIQFQLIVFGQEDPNNVNNMFLVSELRKMGPLTRIEDIDQVDQKLQTLKPKGYTPLLTSMIKAYETLASDSKPGAIVVITDGDANDGATNAQGKLVLNPDEIKRLSSKLESSLNDSRARSRPVELHVIGLDFAGKVGADLKGLVQRIGSFYDHKNGQPPLQDLLGKITKPRPFIVRQDGAAAIELLEAQLGKPIGKLPLGKYRVAFNTIDRLKNISPVELTGGELLKFRLNPADGSIEQYSEAFKGAAPLQKSLNTSPYEFGWDSFRPFGVDDVEFVVGVRRSDNLGTGSLFTPRPRRIVVDINPKGQKLSDPLPLTWDVEPGKSRPTWSIKITDWKSSSVELNAYVSWEPIQADKVFGLAATSNNPDRIELPISNSKTEKAKFEMSVVLPGSDPSEPASKSVKVGLKLKDADAEAAVDREWRHLAYIDVQLLQKDLPMESVEVRQELLRPTREVIWTFTELPEGFQAGKASVAVTSWYSFQSKAFQLEKPLVIPRRDDQ